MSLLLTVVNAKNLPANDLGGTSDPYVKIYLQGPVTSYVGKTSTIFKTLNPVFNEQFSFNPVRGARIKLVVYDHDTMKKDTILSECHFDPILFPFDTEMPIPLFNYLTKAKNDSTILIKVSLQEPSSLPQTSSLAAIKRNPFYITVETKPLLKRETPLSMLPCKGYKFPFELSIISFKDNNYYYASSAERKTPGIFHSGYHPCFSNGSLTQAIRVEPSLSPETLIVCVSTNDFTPLNQIAESFSVVVWSSEEKPFQGKYLRLTSQLLTPVATYNLTLTDFSQVACLARMSSNSEFAQLNFPLPLPSDGQSMPFYILKSIGHDPSDPLRDLPLLTPLSISLFPFPSKSLSVKSNGKHFVVTTISQKLEVLETCNASKPEISKGKIRQQQGTLEIMLDSLTLDVSFVFVSLFINNNESPAFGFKLNPFGDSSPGNVAIYMGQNEIYNTSLTKSRRNNFTMLFALVRDPFSGWSIINIRKSSFYSREDQLTKCFISTVSQLLRV